MLGFDGVQSRPLQDGVKDASAAVQSMFRSSNMERAKGYIQSLTDMSVDAPWKKGLACFSKYLVKPLIIVGMVYAWLFKQIYRVYKMLPMNVVQMIFGAALCFFGGTYFMSLAAIEAFKNFGGQVLLDELRVLYEQGSLVAQASVVDDAVDANNDGIADVKQMTANKLINHKAKVAMKAVTEPEKFCSAIQYMLSAYVSVIAILKSEFARTVAIALGIADTVTPVMVKMFGGVLAMLLGAELKHWVPSILINSVRIMAVIIASYLQAFISAFYSGLRGGRMFAEAFFRFLAERGWLEKLPDFLIAKPFDPNQSYLDEAIAYPLAAAGFYYQVVHAFTLPFPFDLALLPLTIVEWCLRWEVFTS